MDDRHGVGKITSRIGLHQDAIAFDYDFDFLAYVMPCYQKYSCILGMKKDEMEINNCAGSG